MYLYNISPVFLRDFTLAKQRAESRIHSFEHQIDCFDRTMPVFRNDRFRFISGIRIIDDRAIQQDHQIRYTRPREEATSCAAVPAEAGIFWMKTITSRTLIRSTKERTIYKYVNGQAIKKKFKPEPGQRCVNREDIIYSLDFTVTAHQLRHTYITNLIHAGVDPKTIQYLAGHENSKVTMDIYAKAKYNKLEEFSAVVNGALKMDD